jgi:hypothetical protein
MINANQLRELIIRPALKDLTLYSENAETLLMFTCAVESFGGFYLKQINGPALGIYQMEPETYNDIWQNFINNHSNFRLIMISNFNATFMPDEYRLIYDLRFATAMTRLHYERVKEALPDASNIDAVWDYYKHYYNTALGKADKTKSIEKYNMFIRS